MKIVKNGLERTWRDECKKCHTIYEYDESDYFEIEEEKSSGLRKVDAHLFKKDEEYREICKYKWKGLKCPVCGDVKKRLFHPEHVRWEEV